MFAMMIRQVILIVLLSALTSGLYSTGFRKDLAKRIRIYHDVYFQQNFPARRVPDIRVLRPHDTPSDGGEPSGTDQSNSKRAAPVLMMIGNSPNAEEFEAFSENSKRAGPVRMMIGNSPSSDEFEAFSENSKRAGPVRMMIGNSPSSDEFEAFSENSKRAGPVRMMIGNSPNSDEFEAFSDNSKRAGPVRMMIGNSPNSDEFEAFSENSKRAGPVRMMIGNSPSSDEFEAFSENSKRAGPVRMMIGNSPNSDEFEAFSENSKRAGPVRMMIGNSPSSVEFEAFNGDNKRAAPVRVMIRNSPDAEETPEIKSTSDLPKSEESGDPETNTIADSDTIPPALPNNKLCKQNITSVDNTQKWSNFLGLLQKHYNMDMEYYHSSWNQIPRLLNAELLQKFQQTFKAISLKDAIETLSHTDAFFQLFWPFSYENSLMNQKLALFGISGEVQETNIKTTLFHELNSFQDIRMPVAENKVILSFNHPELVDGMNRSSLLQNSHDFVNQGKHLFNKTEEKEIRSKVKSAFRLINRVSPSLYRSIKQLIACIAFYKGQDQIHLGGSVSSALGVIWLDPSTNYNWSVPFYAEQIVHEFTHNALFYEELVHGTFTDHSKFPQAKVISAIRRQLRDYDKSFHAAYVSTGLIVFHSKVGYQKRALNLARPLPSSVRDLVEVNKRTGILTHNGEAMLQTLVDFLTLARIRDE